MSIKRKKYYEMIKKLEKLEQEKPQKYRSRVLLLAVLGYTYIVFILAVAISLVVLSVYGFIFSSFSAVLIYLALAAVPFILFIFNTLWVRIDEPIGVELKPELYPELFKMIDELSREIQSPKPHKVILNDDFNAAVFEKPMLGFFGFSRQYLIIGLPLMHVLSRKEFKAILAHEMGHLSASQSKLSSWIHRIKDTWETIFLGLTYQAHWGAFIMAPFFKWYMPFFDAYSLVLGRSNETTADIIAKKAAGVNELGNALIVISIKERQYRDIFWKNIEKKFIIQDKPPGDVISKMLEKLAEPEDKEKNSEQLQKELNVKTWFYDTHPSLMERLLTIGYLKDENEKESFLLNFELKPTNERASDRYLGANIKGLADLLDFNWMRDKEKMWFERHQYLNEVKVKLRGINKKKEERALTINELVDEAQLVLELSGDDEAYPVYQNILEIEPENAFACFQKGRILLSKGEKEGLELVERSMEKDPMCALLGEGIVESYLKEQGYSEEDQDIIYQNEELIELVNLAAGERSQIKMSDTFTKNTLESGELERLINILKEYDKIKKAYLVKKEVKYYKERHLNILGIVPDIRWYSMELEDTWQIFLESIGRKIDFINCDISVIMLAGLNESYKKKFEAAPDSLIYEKNIK